MPTITIEVPEGAKEIIVNRKRYVAAVEEKNGKRWWRNKGGEYWSICWGAPIKTIDENVGDSIRWNNHNYWKSEADCQLSIDFHRVEAEGFAFVPEEGQKYWRVDGLGNKSFTEGLSSDDYSTKFPTEEKAKEFADLRRRYIEMLRGYQI